MEKWILFPEAYVAYFKNTVILFINRICETRLEIRIEILAELVTRLAIMNWETEMLWILKY